MNYYRRYMADLKRKTSRLTLEEKGAYDAMLDEYYAFEEPLPLDHEEIFRMIGAMKPSERAAVMKILSRYFTEEPDGYHNKRADEEIAVSKKARSNGSGGGRPKKTGNVTGMETGTETDSVTGDETGDETEIETKTVTQGVTGSVHPLNHSTTQPPNRLTAQPLNHPTGSSKTSARVKRSPRPATPGFDEFYASYPKKAGRQEAERQWNLLAPDEDLRTTIMAALEAQKQTRQWSDRNFIKDPERWLKNRRWQDEVPRETAKHANGARDWLAEHDGGAAPPTEERAP